MMSVAGVLLAVSATALLPGGCESQSRVVATEACPPCPLCRVETRIQPITGLEYTRCVCPTCRAVSTVDPALRDALERFTGGPTSETVYVCDACQAVVRQCDICQRGG